VRQYKSFTLKQAGYKFLNDGRVKIQGRMYQYWDSHEIEGRVKTVTVNAHRWVSYSLLEAVVERVTQGISQS